MLWISEKDSKPLEDSEIRTKQNTIQITMAENFWPEVNLSLPS